MTTTQLWKDAAHVLRATIAPALALTAVIASLQVLHPWPGSDVLPAAVLSVIIAWLVLTVAWAATSPLRDRRAAHRLDELRAASPAPNRELVHIYATIWALLAGQLVDVVNIATGTTHRIWLPETSLPVGSFALLERSNDAVAVVDWIPRRTVEAAHRAVARNPVTASEGPCCHDEICGEHDRAGSFVREVEGYLRTQQ